jgi:O-antigen/teichoic acid export membrane protein
VKFLAYLESSSLRLSFIGNATARLWQGILSVVSVPILIGIIGTESYGIICFVQTIQSVLGILDMGLAGTVNREVATHRGEENRRRVADLVRTFEWIYWPMALVVGGVLAIASGWLADSWVAKQSLPATDIRTAIVLGGITLAARWPVSLYTGVLRGIERQVLLNAVLIVAATVRLFMSVLTLKLIAPTVSCFLVTQAAVNVIEVLATGYCARHFADPSGLGRFDVGVLRQVWRFALSFNLVGAFGVLTSAADKLLISRLLPLSAMTYYSVCATATGSFLLVYQAAAVSLFPRMCHCAHSQAFAEMNRLYLMAARLTTYICLGPVMVLMAFPREVLLLWTRSEEIASGAKLLLPVMAGAVMLNCHTTLTYNILIASGHTRLPLLMNLAMLPINWVGTYVCIDRFGVLGAAVCTLAINAVYCIVYEQFCRTHVLQNRATRSGFGLPVNLIVLAAVLGLVSRLAVGRDVTAPWVIFALSALVMIFYIAGWFLLTRVEREVAGGPVLRLCRFVAGAVSLRQGSV